MVLLLLLLLFVVSLSLFLSRYFLPSIITFVYLFRNLTGDVHVISTEWEERKAKIRNEMPFVDIKEYSHNIIGMTLPPNEEDMKKMACELELGKLGWPHLDDAGSYLVSDHDKVSNNRVFLLRATLLYNRRKSEEKSSSTSDDDDDHGRDSSNTTCSDSDCECNDDTACSDSDCECNDGMCIPPFRL